MSSYGGAALRGSSVPPSPYTQQLRASTASWSDHPNSSSGHRHSSVPRPAPHSKRTSQQRSGPPLMNTHHDGPRLPAIHPPPPSDATAAKHSRHFSSTGNLHPDAQLNQEWLNSPRTHRMLQLLGVKPGDEQPPAEKQPLTNNGTRYFQQLQSMQQHDSAFSQTATSSSHPSSMHPPNTLSSTAPYDIPHPPAYEQESKEAVPSSTHPHPQPQQRMFMPVEGVRRFNRKQQFQRGRGGHQTQRQRRPTTQATYPLRPIDRAPTAPFASGPSGSPRDVANQSIPDAALTPERQLLVDFLTDPACRLFRPPRTTRGSENPDAPQQASGEVVLNDEHLDLFLSLPDIGDAPNLIRSLRSLEKLGLEFDDTDDLIIGISHILQRKKFMLDWLLSSACKLFGQSPFVMFLNLQAVDRLVEESNSAKLGQVGPPAEEDPSQPPTPATQPYDDTYHILLRLNEMQHEFHYFSELIAAVRGVVNQALLDAGVTPPDEPQSTSPRSHRHTKPKRSKSSKNVAASQQSQREEEEKQSSQRDDQLHYGARPTKKKSKSPSNAAAIAASTSSTNSHPSSPLHELVLQHISAPESRLFTEAYEHLSRHPNFDHDIDELVKCLSILSSLESATIGPASDSASMSLLQSIEASGRQYSSIAELVQAFKSGRIEAPAPAKTQAHSPRHHQLHHHQHYSLQVDPSTDSTAASNSTSPAHSSRARSSVKAKLSPRGEDASQQQIPNDISPKAFQDKRRRLAVLAHLSKSSLLYPKQDAHDLYAQVFREPIQVDTLSKIKSLELEAYPPVFKNYRELLIHMKDRSIDSPQALRTAVWDFFKDGHCTLVTPELAESIESEDVDRLIDECQAKYSTLKHLRAMQLEQTQTPSATTTDKEAEEEKEAPISQFSSLDELIKVLKQRHHETLQVKRTKLGLPALETLPPVAPASTDDDAPRFAVQHLEKFEIAPTDENLSGSLAIDTQDSTNHQDQITAVWDDVTEQQRLNIIRHDVWDYLHEPTCHIITKQHQWTPEQVEYLVDDLVGDSQTSTSESIVSLLRTEDERLQQEKLAPYPTVNALVEELLRQRYTNQSIYQSQNNDRTPRSVDSSASFHSHVSSAPALFPVPPLESDEVACVLDFLSQPSTTLLHGIQVYEEDIEEIYSVSGADTLLFLWELNDQQRSYASIMELREALGRLYQDSEQLVQSWMKRVQQKVRTNATVLFGSKERGEAVVDELELDQLDVLLQPKSTQKDAPPAAPVHPTSMIHHLDVLIAHANTTAGESWIPFKNFQELVERIHYAELDEARYKTIVTNFILANLRGPEDERFFDRPEIQPTPTAIDRLFAWTQATGEEMLTYFRSLSSTIRITGVFPYWTNLIAFVRTLHQRTRTAIQRETHVRATVPPERSEVSPGSVAPVAEVISDSLKYPELDTCSRRMLESKSTQSLRMADQRSRRMDAETRMRTSHDLDSPRGAATSGAFDTTPAVEVELKGWKKDGQPAEYEQPKAGAIQAPKVESTVAEKTEGYTAAVAATPIPDPLYSPRGDADQHSLPAHPTAITNLDDLKYEHALARLSKTFDQKIEVEAKMEDPLRSGRLDARWRITVARENDHARELHLHDGTSSTSSLHPSEVAKPVELISSITVEPSSMTFSPMRQRHTLTVHSHEQEADGTIYLIKLFSSNPLYTIAAINNPAYLHPGQSVVFDLGNTCNTPASREPSDLVLYAKPVLASEPSHFQPDELWTLNVNRITQMKTVCIAKGNVDDSAHTTPTQEPMKVMSSTTSGSDGKGCAVDPPPFTVNVTPVPVATRVAPIEATSSNTAPSVTSPADGTATPILEMHLPSVDPEDAALQQNAAKRRAKRMTQAVDMNAIRASGMLKKLEGTTTQANNEGAAASTTSSAIALPFAQHQPPIAVTSNSSPVAIAIADSQTATMDATTKRRNKRMTQVTGSLADHVKQAATAKLIQATTPTDGSPSPNIPVALNPQQPSYVANSASPVAIARMDEDMSQLSPEQKRKAKRSTQAVDPLLAAAMMQRVLAAQPAPAQDTIANTVTASTATSPIAIAAADDATANMTALEKRRAKRSTSITNELPPHVKIGLQSGKNPGSASESPVQSGTSSPVPTVTNPSGAVAVAVADSMVAAMSPRERNRGKRMTQALFDSSYDAENAKLRRPSEFQEAEKLIPTSLARLEDAANVLRVAPRLNIAIEACQMSDFYLSKAFLNYRIDSTRRITTERFNDKVSFPPKIEYPPSKPINHFVESLGSLTVTPANVVLYPKQSKTLTIHNQGEFAVCVFALASDEEFVIDTPTPAFISPNASLLLQVHCDTVAHPVGAEIGLVFKPLAPSEEKVSSAADVWSSHPYRIMQKVHVPIECVEEVTQTITPSSSKSTLSPPGTGQSRQPHPPSTDRSLAIASERHRRAKSRRVSGTDFAYPAAPSTPVPGKDSPQKPAAANVTSVAPTTVVVASTPVRNDTSPRLEASSNASLNPSREESYVNSYRTDAKKRLTQERTHEKSTDYLLQPTGSSDIVVISPPPSDPHQPLTSDRSSSDLEAAVGNRLSRVTPQERQSAYRTQIRLDADTRIMQQRHQEYPEYASATSTEHKGEKPVETKTVESTP